MAEELEDLKDVVKDSGPGPETVLAATDVVEELEDLKDELHYSLPYLPCLSCLLLEFCFSVLVDCCRSTAHC